MTTAPIYSDAPDIQAEDYVVIGVATCFTRNEGEVQEITVLEPIPSASLETLLAGLATSYKMAYGTTVGTILSTEPKQPQALSGIPAGAVYCADFAERVMAAARTYRRVPELAQRIPVGSQYDQLNYSTQRKRVLNAENSVSMEDNVKQHAYTHQIL